MSDDYKKHAGKPITPEALSEGGPQVMAWAVDPESGAVRGAAPPLKFTSSRSGEEI